MPRQAEFQVTPHIRPLTGDDAVDVRVAHRAVPAGQVMADHSILLRAECFDRFLRAKIKIIRTQAHHLAAELVERMLEQNELAGGVHVASLPALRIPGVADLDPIDRGDDIVIPRAADYRARFDVAYDPRKHVAILQATQSGGDIGLGLFGRRHRREPQLPERTVGSRLLQLRHMGLAHRLEPDGAPLEDDRNGIDHPSLLSAAFCYY